MFMVTRGLCYFRGSPSSLSALMDMTHQVRAVELLLMNPKVSNCFLLVWFTFLFALSIISWTQLDEEISSSRHICFKWFPYPGEHFLICKASVVSSLVWSCILWGEIALNMSNHMPYSDARKRNHVIELKNVDDGAQIVSVAHYSLLAASWSFCNHQPNILFQWQLV